VVSIVGARPQFIKLAAVSRAFIKYGISEEVIHTGQHFDSNMSEVFFEEMQLKPPTYNLDINQMSHGAMTGRMLEEIEKILILSKPDFVMVFGDTNSTLAGAIAAKKLKISLVHVEAGLRSFNMDMPEEINRILTDRISDILFCPTESAVSNLDNEGYSNMPSLVINSGDVMLDSVKFYSNISSTKSTIISNLNLSGKPFLLCTIHRESNTDNRENFAELITALNVIAIKTKIVFPVHPRTRALLKDYDLHSNIDILNPVGYFDMLEMLKACKYVLTDSGGMQKEAFFFRKYCITMREDTEWTELVEHNYNILTGANAAKIKLALKTFNTCEDMDFPEFYGNGKAGETIAQELVKYNLDKNSSY